VDAAGNLFVMNLGTDGVIGKLSPGATKSVPFATLPDGGIGSGARFDREGRMYVADFKKHRVHVFEPGFRLSRMCTSSPASSISPTTWRSRRTARSTPAIRSGRTVPAEFGASRAARMERLAAR